MALKVNVWVKPYIHQNMTELITNLATGVQNGFISKQTASERATEYAKNDEIDRYWREDLKKRQRELEFKIKEQKAQVQADIRKQEEMAAINRRFNGQGQDVNTGHGGRPRTVDTDEWGNRQDGSEHNWDEWNRTH